VAAFVAALIGEDDATLASLSEAIAEARLAKQRLLAQAIAMSGRPQWRRLLTELKRAVPARALEIETLLAAPEAPVTLSAAFDESGVVLDMVFAHFMATGRARRRSGASLPRLRVTLRRATRPQRAARRRPR
jgi:hypothetical protein